MSYWFEQMASVAGLKYAEQIAFLRENHAFSQAHANALVLYCRGSVSAKRFDTVQQYLTGVDETKRITATAILDTITKKYPGSTTVIAWNKPMVKIGDEYVFSLSVHTNHILLAPWGDHMIDAFQARLTGYEVNKKTIKVPADWKVDKKLILDMVALRLTQLKDQ